MSNTPQPVQYLVSYYCVNRKVHVNETLEKSVRDTMKNHDNADYGVNSSKYDEDKKMRDHVHEVMKRCNYKPRVNKDGKFKPVNGAYFFMFAG